MLIAYFSGKININDLRHNSGITFMDKSTREEKNWFSTIIGTIPKQNCTVDLRKNYGKSENLF